MASSLVPRRTASFARTRTRSAGSLRGGRREVAVEVQAALADRHHALRLRELLEPRERALVGLRDLVRVDADRGPHVRLLGGERDRALVRAGVVAHFEEARHAGLP